MTNFNFFEKISEQLENNINEYLTDEEREEVQTFDDLYDILNDTDFFTVDIIYYFRAMEFLKEHDPSLSESLELASQYDYRPNQLNSELLASLLASEMHREKVHSLEEQINEHFKTVCKWCEKETKERFCSNFCKGEFYGISSNSGDEMPFN